MTLRYVCSFTSYQDIGSTDPAAISLTVSLSSTVITKLKVNPGPSACQAGSTTEYPQFLMNFVCVPVFQEQTICTEVMLVSKGHREGKRWCHPKQGQIIWLWTQRRAFAMFQWGMWDRKHGPCADSCLYTWAVCFGQKEVKPLPLFFPSLLFLPSTYSSLLPFSSKFSCLFLHFLLPYPPCHPFSPTSFLSPSLSLSSSCCAFCWLTVPCLSICFSPLSLSWSLSLYPHLSFSHISPSISLSLSESLDLSFFFPTFASNKKKGGRSKKKKKQMAEGQTVSCWAISRSYLGTANVHSLVPIYAELRAG